MSKLRILLLLSSGGILATALTVACMRVGRYEPGRSEPYGIGYPVRIFGSISVPVIFGYTLSDYLNKRSHVKSKKSNSKS